jgi:glucosyl-dolichyl phosphate glucuronosyltransferase
VTTLSEAKLSVILATHNGSDVLPDMLNGYTAIQPPDRPWAMVVVDNASTDETPDILNAFGDRLPITVLREPVPSKNRALNHALDNIGRNADLYIFTDDDAIPAPDYLCRWEDVLQERQGNELFGATVQPYFRHPPPAWLNRLSGHFAELYAKLERPSGEIPAADIYGPNMAVRRGVLLRGHRFNENIGPNSQQINYPMGSENEFCIRVSSDSAIAPWFAAEPIVRHIVRPYQMTRDFIWRRAFRHGRGFAMRQFLATGVCPPTLGIKNKVKLGLLWVAAPLSTDAAWWQYNWWRGYEDWITEKCQEK